MYKAYVRTEYLHWRYPPYGPSKIFDRTKFETGKIKEIKLRINFFEVRQSVRIPPFGQCAPASFNLFMLEAEDCGDDLKKIPGLGYDTCFRRDPDKKYRLWE